MLAARVTEATGGSAPKDNGLVTVSRKATIVNILCTESE